MLVGTTAVSMWTIRGCVLPTPRRWERRSSKILTEQVSMQKIGLIGGMSWTSTVRYYQIINGAIHDRLGGLHSAPMLMESLDFAAVAHSNTDEEWERTADILIGAAQRLEMAGATEIVICAHSMHKVYEKIVAAVAIHVPHIADRPEE